VHSSPPRTWRHPDTKAFFVNEFSSRRSPPSPHKDWSKRRPWSPPHRRFPSIYVSRQLPLLSLSPLASGLPYGSDQDFRLSPTWPRFVAASSGPNGIFPTIGAFPLLTVQARVQSRRSPPRLRSEAPLVLSNDPTHSCVSLFFAFFSYSHHPDSSGWPTMSASIPCLNGLTSWWSPQLFCPSLWAFHGAHSFILPIRGDGGAASSQRDDLPALT